MCSRFHPVEFNRAPRSLKFFKLFKGHEWEHILLYYGIFVWKDILPSNIYHHFLTLHCAVYILSSSSYKNNIPLAKYLLKQFVTKTEASEKRTHKHSSFHSFHPNLPSAHRFPLHSAVLCLFPYPEIVKDFCCSLYMRDQLVFKLITWVSRFFD